MSCLYFIKSFLLFLIVATLTGCAVDLGFNQLDTLKRLSQFRTKTQLSAQLWEVRIGENYQHTAIPVQHEEGMTFYIQDGTEIDFVGWDVTALRNWNYYGKAIEVERSGRGLEHHFIDGLVRELSCTEYDVVSDFSLDDKALLDGKILRVASCKGFGLESWQYNNAVVLNEKGVALWMYHHVAPNMPPIELWLRGKNKPGSSPEFDYKLLLE